MEQPVEKVYTYSDLLAMDENVRAELIYGDLYMMSPAPSRSHQDISIGFESWILDFLKDKPCKMYHAPMDVRLFENDEDSSDDVDTAVQPDIFVVCDHNKLDERGCKGAPDFIIEIISPFSARHDKFVKRNLYARAGVREYWIVDPQNRTVEVLLLDENKRLSLTEVYTDSDIAKVTVLPGCGIDLSRVFPEPEVPRKRKVL